MSFQGQRGLTNDQRFDAKFVKGAGCWEWLGGRDPDGYGFFWDAVTQCSIRAHRYALERIVGPLGALQACHSCDNPPCVRPDHLFAGTESDNMNDKAEKGRTLGFAAMKGEKHTQAKLTEEQVVTIKHRLRSGERQGSIAADFSVGQSLISRIQNGKIWTHVTI